METPQPGLSPRAPELVALTRCLHAVATVMEPVDFGSLTAWLGVDIETLADPAEGLPPVAVGEAVSLRVAGLISGVRVMATFEVIPPDEEGADEE